MRCKGLLIVCVLYIFFSTGSFAQTKQIYGLWLVEKVTLGNEKMTPVAKWTRIHDNGTYESGNGWLKNSEGSWLFDETERSFLPKEKKGITDPFGSYNVRFEKDKMVWTREEEGMEVTVTLRQIDDLPMSTADEVKGLWGLTEATDGGQSIKENIDPKGIQYLHIRWDRIYAEGTSEVKRQTGYWHMHGHRPDITLMSHSGEKEPESWRVAFSESGELVLTGISDSNRNKVFTYSRLAVFPE